MSDLPLVSVVIPNLNQQPYLEDAIRSVLDQDYPNLELILIDGGSTDGSMEIIQKYAASLSYWVSERDTGQSQAVNKGLQQAHGEILTWLNSDDMLSPGAVSLVVQVFYENPLVDFVHGRIERIDEDGQLIPTPLLPKDSVDFGVEKILGECVINQPGSFWRKRIMQRSGMLDEDLRYAMDYEYWVRMALAGVRFQRLPLVLARFRLTSGSKTVGQTADQALEQLVVLKRIQSTAHLAWIMRLSPMQVWLRARRTRARIYLQVAYGYFKLRRHLDALVYFLKALLNDPSSISDPRYRLLFGASRRRISQKSAANQDSESSKAKHS